LRHKDNYTLW